jgi:hypothetical protein
MAERAGESERAEVGDDRWGRAVSERERENARAHAGRAGTRERGRGRVAAGRSAGPSRRKEGESAREESFIFLFQKCE